MHTPLRDVLAELIPDKRAEFEETNGRISITLNLLKKFTISGTISDASNGEVLPGAYIQLSNKRIFTQSNAYGFYSLTLPSDTYTVYVTYMGYKPVMQNILLINPAQVNIKMEQEILDEVEIVGKEDKFNRSMHHIEVNLAGVDHMPAILNEKDAVRYTMLMPGVQKGSEGNGYLYVRGGGAEQNLIILDDAVIYNANHLLGLNTIFSGSELKRAELTKGAFSPRFSGRLSSVLDLRLKDGNLKRLSGELSSGFISSKIMVEGPLIKDRSSFLVSYRQGYLGAASRLVSDASQDPLYYNNYDFHAKLSSYLGKRDRLMISTYVGKDVVGDEQKARNVSGNLIRWGNNMLSLKWNHAYNNKLFSNFTAVYSKYNALFEMGDQSSFSRLNSGIEDYGLKIDFDYIPHVSHYVKTGASFTSHYFSPSIVLETFNAGNISTNKVGYEKTAYEGGAYIEDIWKVTSKTTISMGLRASTFKLKSTSYLRLEPRINYQFEIRQGLFANASYSLMNQYLHMVSSAGLGIQYDVWLPSSQDLKPLRSNLITLGLTKNNLLNGKLLIAVEGYYKRIENQVLFKDGSNFLSLVPFNPRQYLLEWEDVLTQGKCTSYGLEALIKKEGKKWSGWISYTLSKTDMEFAEINKGKIFPAFYDRRHDLGIVVEWKPSRRWTLSSTWIYGSGYAITMPSSQYFVARHTPGRQIPQMGFSDPGTGIFDLFPSYHYDSKNGYRMIDYHKLDIAIQYHFNMGKRIKGDVLLSVYNVYNRSNAFQYSINSDDIGNRSLYMSSLFPVIPSLSLNLKF